MTRPLLRVVNGAADSRHVSLLSANSNVAYWEEAHDRLVLSLLGAPSAELSMWRFRLMAAHDRLMAACARRDRIEAEMAGQRWLEVVDGA